MDEPLDTPCLEITLFAFLWDGMWRSALSVKIYLLVLFYHMLNKAYRYGIEKYMGVFVL